MAATRYWGRKCLALRIGVSRGAQKKAGWPNTCSSCAPDLTQREKYYVAAAFPSACGKTNLAMLQPTLADWKSTCLGDDIAWIRRGQDGRLFAMNPETGFFGVAPGTSMKSIQCGATLPETASSQTSCSRPVAMCGGKTWVCLRPGPAALIGKEKNGHPRAAAKARTPNSRFTAPASQCPVLDRIGKTRRCAAVGHPVRRSAPEHNSFG